MSDQEIVGLIWAINGIYWLGVMFYAYVWPKMIRRTYDLSQHVYDPDGDELTYFVDKDDANLAQYDWEQEVVVAIHSLDTYICPNDGRRPRRFHNIDPETHQCLQCRQYIYEGN